MARFQDRGTAEVEMQTATGETLGACINAKGEVLVSTQYKNE